MMADLITVKSVKTDNKVCLWEVNPEHPNGEVFIYADGLPHQVARTSEVALRLNDRVLVEVDEPAQDARFDAEKQTAQEARTRGEDQARLDAEAQAEEQKRLDAEQRTNDAERPTLLGDAQRTNRRRS